MFPILLTSCALLVQVRRWNLGCSAVMRFGIEAVDKGALTCIYTTPCGTSISFRSLGVLFDDWIYYTPSFGNCVQFVVAVTCFSWGLGAVLLDGAASRAIMMFITTHLDGGKVWWSSHHWKQRMALEKVRVWWT